MRETPFKAAPLSVLYVVSWAYEENANRLEGGGGGQEWRYTREDAEKVFTWALSGWAEHPCTTRLTAIPAPDGMLWSEDNERIGGWVSDFLDTIECPEDYPEHWTLIAECKWMGGAS